MTLDDDPGIGDAVDGEDHVGGREIDGQRGRVSLLFFGDPVHHVGIYAGGGTMINAPFSGSVVRYDSIERRHYSGARRVV